MRIPLLLILALPSLSVAFQQEGGHFHSTRIPGSSSSLSLNYKPSSWLDPSILNEKPKVTKETPWTPDSYVSRPNYNRHYSASDWLYNLKTWRHSSVMREIKNPVMALGGWATFISVVHKVLLMNGKTMFASNLCIPPVAHSFLVSSLGLLLVFRTNSAYQRFMVSNHNHDTVWSLKNSKH